MPRLALNVLQGFAGSRASVRQAAHLPGPLVQVLWREGVQAGPLGGQAADAVLHGQLLSAGGLPARLHRPARQACSA